MRALDADRIGGARRPDARRHATVPQSWIQRENWEFETHGRTYSTSARSPCVRRHPALARALEDVGGADSPDLTPHCRGPRATAGTPRSRQPARLPPRRHPRPALAHGRGAPPVRRPACRPASSPPRAAHHRVSARRAGPRARRGWTHGSPQAWRTRPAHRQAHRRPTARDPAAAATSAHLPQQAAHTATGGARGRNRPRSPGMGPTGATATDAAGRAVRQ